MTKRTFICTVELDTEQPVDPLRVPVDLGVRDHPVVDLVEIGLALPIVALVAHEVDVGALAPLLELERAGADRPGVVRVLPPVGVLVERLRDDRRGGGVESVQERRERRLR